MGKEKFGNESLVGEGQCLTWENFLWFTLKIFDVERSLYIFCTNCLSQDCGVKKIIFQLHRLEIFLFRIHAI